jgi:hypothetical protein
MVVVSPNLRVTYRIKNNNANSIAAGASIAIEDQANARKNGNVPHNSFTLANTSSTCTLFIYLDNYADVDSPDYVLFPNSIINVGLEDGVTFTTLWVRNTHASTAVAAKELKYNVVTIKEQP